jgi:hypothetical protein
MSITKNQKPQNSLPEGLHNATERQRYFLKTAGCLEEKYRTWGHRTPAIAQLGQRTPDNAHVVTLRPVPWRLRAAFPVEACERPDWQAHAGRARLS